MNKLIVAVLVVLSGCAHPQRVVDSTPGLRTPPGCVFVGSREGRPAPFQCGGVEQPVRAVAEEKLSLLEIGALTVSAWSLPSSRN